MEFNLEKALKDGKAMTRYGQEVTQLVRFDCDNKYALFGVIDGLIGSWSLSGTRARDDATDPLDLQNIPEKLSGFVCHHYDGTVTYFKQKPDRKMYDDGLMAIIALSQFNVGHGLEEE